MPRAAEMLATHPGSADIDTDLFGRTIEALAECAVTCAQCADACLAEDEPAAMARCIRLDLDCADICTATSRVLSRQTEFDADVARPLLEACIAACLACGDECAAHAEHMAHCKVCSETCRGCATACRELLGALA
jgi:hypothetical protein